MHTTHLNVSRLSANPLLHVIYFQFQLKILFFQFIDHLEAKGMPRQQVSIISIISQANKLGEVI